jgi:hypothetical protein
MKRLKLWVYSKTFPFQKYTTWYSEINRKIIKNIINDKNFALLNLQNEDKFFSYLSVEKLKGTKIEYIEISKNALS